MRARAQISYRHVEPKPSAGASHLTCVGVAHADGSTLQAHLVTVVAGFDGARVVSVRRLHGGERDALFLRSSGLKAEGELRVSRRAQAGCPAASDTCVFCPLVYSMVRITYYTSRKYLQSAQNSSSGTIVPKMVTLCRFHVFVCSGTTVLTSIRFIERQATLDERTWHSVPP
ncbi:hypothetical protein PsYK624_054380 [Phanerochaete sordida]|uniref:Uncharacterized protein n=1 Tax=Phanerochaete sordida TaxID=48140 RepID=A0A9P3G7N7_9APHY|nr:hypothetical protein PsYK624_054380 [Phanerochaete sordida]